MHKSENVSVSFVLKPHLNPNALCYDHTIISPISFENTWVCICVFFFFLSIVDVYCMLLAIEMAKKGGKIDIKLPIEIERSFTYSDIGFDVFG